MITELIDDLDGTTLGSAGETVYFSLDGKAYEIDLSGANADALREAFAPYISASRTVSASGRRTEKSSRSSARTGGQDLGAIREWARANGIEVSARGRVSAKVIDAYTAAH